MNRRHGAPPAGLALTGVGLLIVVQTALELSPRDGALLIGLTLIVVGGVAAVVAELRGIRARLDEDGVGER